MMYNTFKEFQDAVVYAVKQKLQHEEWFRGVCVDDMEEYYKTGDFDEAVSQAYCNTLFYDAPSMGF